MQMKDIQKINLMSKQNIVPPFRDFPGVFTLCCKFSQIKSIDVQSYLVGGTVAIESHTQLIGPQVFAGQSHTSAQRNLEIIKHK